MVFTLKKVIYLFRCTLLIVYQKSKQINFSYWHPNANYDNNCADEKITFKKGIYNSVDEIITFENGNYFDKRKLLSKKEFP